MRWVLLLPLLAACSTSLHSMHRPPPQPFARAHERAANTESYKDWGKNPWIATAQDHLSTFAADVDTASYTIARRKLLAGGLPPPASVRVEEWVNYFKYSFPPAAQDTPFSVVMDAAAHPFETGRYIVRAAVATRPKTVGERKPSHLVFLVDVSGSMDARDKLELAKESLHILTDQLTEKDSVALVTYAGDSRLVLPRTRVANQGSKDRIHAAIRSLSSGGSTAMASGIDLAYEQAIASVAPGAISRVIVLTDGDANVGPHSQAELLNLIARRAKQGVTLSTIGFGMGNYKDYLMEQLADKGNGNNYYIDSIEMARRVFQEQLTATLEVAAKDVKLQVDFDPTQVARYRLIGYENRDVADRDFRNDAIGGGQVGWGHQVTAMYEVELTADGNAQPGLLGLLRIRHKHPEADGATESVFGMSTAPSASLAAASADLRFAFAVAAFADVLRGGEDAKRWSLEEIRALAAGSSGDDKDRAELLSLLERAQKLHGVAMVAR